MTERATSSIPVDTFSTDRDDFGEWIKLFEDAVRLATGATEDERLKVLFRQWLPIKLDTRARTIYSNCTKDGWEDLKTEFRDCSSIPKTDIIGKHTAPLSPGTVWRASIPWPRGSGGLLDCMIGKRFGTSKISSDFVLHCRNTTVGRST